MTTQRKQTKMIWFIWTILFVVSGCDYLTSGEQYYNRGLEFYKSADDGDVYDYPEMQKAANNFEKAVEKGFRKRDVFDKLTWSYRTLNEDNKKMDSVYSLAISSFPNDIEFYYRRGECRKELKYHKEAFLDFNKAILLDTARQYEYINDAFYERGAMIYILGDTINAEKDREIAKSITEHELRTYRDYSELWK